MLIAAVTDAAESTQGVDSDQHVRYKPREDNPTLRITASEFAPPRQRAKRPISC